MASNSRGLLMVLQRWTGATWVNTCGVTNMTFTIRNSLGEEERVNCTTPDSVVETLQYYGAQGYTISYDGLWDSDAEGVAISDAARDQTNPRLRAYVPGDGWYDASWAISQVEWQRGSTGGLKHSAQLSSHGTLTYTAE